MTHTHTHTPQLGNEATRDEEVLFRVEQMKELCTTDAEGAQESIEWLSGSPDNVADALDVLSIEAALRARHIERERNGLGNDLEHWIAVARAATSAPDEEDEDAACDFDVRREEAPVSVTPHGGLARPCAKLARLALPGPRSLVAAVFAIALIGGALSYWLETTEVVPTPASRRLELPGGTVMTTDPYTSAEVRFNLETRDVTLRSGGADFDVSKDGRTFRVNTPHGAVTALGTRFHVRVEGAGHSARTIVLVREGDVRVDRNAKHPDSAILVKNEEANFALEGDIEITQVDLPQFTNEPLGRLAAMANGSGRSPRIVVNGMACSYRISGSFDPADPTELIDHIRTDRNLAMWGDRVVFVTHVADRELSTAQRTDQNGCNADVGERYLLDQSETDTELLP